MVIGTEEISLLYPATRILLILILTKRVNVNEPASTSQQHQKKLRKFEVRTEIELSKVQRIKIRLDYREESVVETRTQAKGASLVHSCR